MFTSLDERCTIRKINYSTILAIRYGGRVKVVEGTMKGRSTEGSDSGVKITMLLRSHADSWSLVPLAMRYLVAMLSKSIPSSHKPDASPPAAEAIWFQSTSYANSTKTVLSALS